MASIPSTTIQPASSPPSWFLEFLSGHIRDLAICITLAIVAVTGSIWASGKIDPVAFEPEANNVWFEADLPRVHANMVNRHSNHYRTKVHPLFSLGAYPPTEALDKLGLSEEAAVRVVIAMVAGLWAAGLFVLLRLMGLRSADAGLFSVIGLVSAGSIFWFAVPETYTFGSLSIVFALGVAAVAQHRAVSHWWYVAAGALTLSFTTTNWMVGLSSTFPNVNWRKGIQISTNALVLVVLLWGLQKFAFPSAQFFIGDREETTYILQPDSGGILRVLPAFIFHSIVAPALDIVDIATANSNWQRLSVQFAWPGSASVVGALAAFGWAALLAIGILSFVKGHGQARLRMALAASVVGQLALHLVYGQETFLYSLHFLPLLIAVAAMGAVGRFRVASLSLALLLLPLLAFNNGSQFLEAARFYTDHSPDKTSPLAPGEIEGLQLWLDASRLSHLEDGDAVSSWPDSSDHANEAIQTEAGRQPLFQSGVRSAVVFDGEDDFLRIVDNPTINVGDENFTIIVMFRRDPAAQTNLRLLSKGAHIDSASGYGLDGANDTLVLRLGDGQKRIGANTSHSGPGEFHLTTFVVDRLGGQVSTYTDGARGPMVPIGDIGAGIDSAFDLYIASTPGPGNYWRGAIADIVLFGHALTLQERLAVERYLQDN